MTRRDIERFVRNQNDVTTDAERDRRRINEVRYANPNPDQKLIEPTSYARPFFTPPGFQTGDITTVAAPPSGDANGIYLGQADTDKVLVTVRMNVTTGGSTITYAELAICTATEVPMGGPIDLSLNGYTGVAGTFNSTGIKDTEISVNLARGAHCFLVWGSQATTPFQVRGGLGDNLGTGYYVVSAAVTRPSTMADPTSFTASVSGARAAWIAVQW